MTDDQGVCARLDCAIPQHEGLLCHEDTRRLFGKLRSLLPRDAEQEPAPLRGRPLTASAPGPGGRDIHERLEDRELWPAGTVGRRQTLPWETRPEGWSGLAAQLQLNLSRQSKRGSIVRGRSSDSALVFDTSSSRAIRDLTFVLGDWAKKLTYDGEDRPPATMLGLATWFLEHQPRVRAWPDRQQLTNLWHAITETIDWANRIIDARPTYRFVGPCPICDRGDVYAPAHAETGICRACAEVVTGIPDMRKANDDKVRAMLVTRAQLWRQVLPTLDDVYGLSIKPATVKKWITRRRLTVAALDFVDAEESLGEGEQLYRVGDVLDLAADLRSHTAGGKSA